MRSFGKFKIRFFSFVLFISVLFSFLITSSCEIGLGAAVDTLVPTINIDSPAADSTIRDSFSFRGTWSDDGAIMGLTVTLNTIEGDTVGQPALTKSGIVNYAQVIGQANTWECTIEPGSEGLKDGKYEATVTITDMAGHATSVNRQITVDNTAPVVVLQRPGTDLEAAAGEMDSYGQTLSLEGQAADDSSISHIDVKVYADSKLTQLLDTVTLTNVPPTISLDVAKFGEIDYTKIYGSSEKQGTKYFWCEIEAYDSAERYPADGSEQSEEDKNGNCEKTYYLYEEIATSVLSQYKITELYKMKSGTWKDSGERSAEGISAILSEKVKRGGSFSLNPDNSPTFRVISGGLEGLKGGEENFSNGKNSITNGGELAIEVNPGLDNIPLAAGMKVYAVECDGNGNVLEGAVKLYPAGADSATKSGTKYTINPVFNQSTGSDGTGGFVFNRTYLLGVEGADESGNAIVAKEGAYGFIFTSSGARPAVTVVTPDENEHFIAKDGTQTVSGSVTVEEGLAALEIKVYRAGDEANAVTVSDSPESASHALYQSVNENGTNSFNYVIDCGAAPFKQDESGNYVIKVRASQGAKETVVTRSISYDVKGPEVKRISCEPVIKANDNSDTGKKNGTISVTGEFSDDKSGFENGSWKVWKAAETGAVNASTAGSLTWQEVSGLGGSLGAEEFNFNVDTRQVETSTSVMRGMKLEFTAEDAAGNTKRTEYYYTVDQSTDIPSAGGNAKLDLTLAYNGSSGTDGLRQEVEKDADVRKNVFTTGGQLVMSVKDDDGIASVVVQTVKNAAEGSDTFGEGGEASQPVSYTDFNSMTSASVTHPLPQVSGSYRVIVTITDTAGVPETGRKEYTFYVQVTGPAPEATVSGSPEWITTNAVSGLAIDSVRGLPKTKFAVSVKVTDGSERVDGGPAFLVKRSGAAGDTWTESGSVQLETDSSDSSGKTYKEGAAGYVPQAGTTKILYRVYDLFNNYKDIAFNYKIDNTAPGVGFTSSEPTTSDTENASFTFRGAASDRESGVSKVEISFDGGASWEAVSGTTGWNYNAVFADKYTSEGAKSVKVRSVDEVGNRSAEAQQSFMYDRAKPVLGAIEYQRSGESSWSAAGSSFSTGNPFELKGTAADTNGVAKVEISEWKDGECRHTYTLTPSTASTSYEWSQAGLPYTRGSGNALVTGSYTYRVKVYDVSDATNPKTEEKTFTLNIDLDAPEVSAVNGLSAGTNLSILDAATYAFSGKVKDLPAADAEGNTPATGVESMEYAITGFYGSDGTTEINSVPSGTAWTSIAKTTNKASEEDWNTAPWTLNEGNGSTAAANSLNEGKYKIWIRAKDKAGNAGRAVSRAFYVDKAAPELSFAANATDAGNGYLNKSSLTGTSGSLNLNGQAVETNGFEYLRYKKNNGTPEELTPDADGNWNLGFTYGSGSGSSHLADGTYTFTVEARDKAGREGNTLTRSWTIDTKEPEVSAATSGLESDGVTKKEITAGRWFKSRTVSIEVPAADNAATGGQASGISLVEWSTDGTNWNAITKDANADIYKGPVEFTGTGAQTLYIRATDRAGNETFWPSSSGISVNIDETAPLLEKTKYQVEGNDVSDEDSVYINGTKALTVYGSYSDSESGVKALSVKKSDGASTFTALDCSVTYTTEANPSETSSYAAYDTISNKKTITGWKCGITAEALDAAFPAAVNGNRASIKLRFDGENMADATTTLVAYSLIWDETPPAIPENAIILRQKTATETSYTDDVYKKDGVYYLNPTEKTLYVSGSASDKSGLASVTATMGGVSGNLPEGAEFSNEAWEFTGFNGFAAADEDNTEKTIIITAIDKAGNSNTATLKIRSDITGPTGIHLIDDSGKDIFFRVGNYNADTNEGISSDTASDTAENVWSAGAKYIKAKDEDVGGKYSGGTFGNAMTVTVRGRYEDVVNGTEDPLAAEAVKGSGLKMIYYKVYSSKPTFATEDALMEDALMKDVVAAGNKISPKEDTKRVFYKDSSSEAAGKEFTGYNTYVEGTDAGTTGGNSPSKVGSHVSVKSEGYIGKVGGKNRDRNWTTIKTSFCETLSGFGEGANYFVLVAEDNAGNRSVDTVRNVPVSVTSGSGDTATTTTTYERYTDFSINVDTEVPDIAPESTATVYTNLAGVISLSGTAGDTGKESDCVPAGISSIELEVNGHKITEDGTEYGSVTVTDAKDTSVEGKARKNKNWSAVIKANAFTGLSGNITVYAEVKDASGIGNSQRVSVATVNVDEGAPVPSIEEPADADDETEGTQVNRIISLGGSARDDESSVERVLGLCYTASTTDHAKPEMVRHSLSDTYSDADSTDSWYSASGKTWVPTGWTKISCSKSGSTSSRLSFTGINTEHLDGSTATSGKVWISAAVQDKAGNIGYSEPVEVIINQDSDRPKVTFSNIELGSSMASDAYIWLKNTTKIIGTVKDDDGVQSMKISLDGTDWEYVTLNGSAFSYDLQDFYTVTATETKEAQANGVKTIYFQIEDKGKNAAGAIAPKTFTSGTTNTTTAVYISDGTDTYGGGENPADPADTPDPKAGSILYVTVDTLYPEVVLMGAKLATAAESEYGTTYSHIKLGGSNTSFNVKINADDTNGINKDEVGGTADFMYEVDEGNGNITSQKVTVNAVKTRQPLAEDGKGEYILTFTLNTSQTGTLSGKDGSVKVKISAEDKAGNASSQTTEISYDFKPSEITFSNPSGTETLSGVVQAYGSLSETAKVWYTVSPGVVEAGGSVNSWTDSNGNTTPFESVKTVYDWQLISESTLAWAVDFDNRQEVAGLSGIHGKSFNKYIIDYGIAEKDTGSTASDAIVPGFEKFVKMYLWIKTEDSAGNTKTSYRELLIDPQGDKPQLSISYPNTNNESIGGEINVYGTATDTKGSDGKIGVDSVWVQIKSTTHKTAATAEYGTNPSYDEEEDTVSMELTAADLDYMKNNGYSVYKMSTYGTAQQKEWTSLATGESASDYGALAELSGAAWNITINTDANKELDPPSSTGGTNPVAIRVIARDKDLKFSAKKDRFVNFDADTPQITDLKLVQSDDEGIETASKAEKTYNSEMYVKGVWYVKGTATDKDKIKTLKIGSVELVKNGVITAAGTGKVKLYSTGNRVEFKYALTPATGVGTATLEIRATDNATPEHTGTASVSVKYDNTPPVIAQTAAQGKNISPDIQQQNSWYTFASRASEPAADDGTSQSGFAYTVFYFVRENNVENTKTLYDVLRSRSQAAVRITGDKFYSNDEDTTGTSIAAMGDETYNSENSIVTDSGIYWYRKTISNVSGSSFTMSNLTGVRKNSLLKIKGAFYLITNITGTTITVDSNIPSGETVAYAAIAGVIDHTVAESRGDGEIQEDGYYESPSRDDGDRMIEAVVKSGTDWDWEASICSRNIPDGPVKLHYVVFDKAGNLNSAYVEGTVSNNRPRIAGVTVKTDYNGDGDVNDEGETINNYSMTQSYSQYWTAGTEGDSSTYVFDPDKTVKNSAAKNALPVSKTFGSATADTEQGQDGPVAALRGKTEIWPEIVGGNGGIFYSYNITNNTKSPQIVKTGENPNAFIANGSIDYTVESGAINIQLGDLLEFEDTKDASTGIPFYFKFWDSTEGTQKFSTTNSSQTAELTMYFAIQAKKVGTPEVKIKPFYWEDIKHNSVYGSSGASKYSDLKGHIELEGELPAANFAATNTDKLMDRDPKVSGKIVIEGTAHDDKLINNITAVIYGTEYTLTGTQTHATNKKALAEYSGETLVSNYPVGSFGTNHLSFVISDEEIGSAGHSLKWALSIDTEQIGGLGIDSFVTVKATNFGVPSVSTTDGTLRGIDGQTLYNSVPGYTDEKSNTPGTTQTASTTDGENNPVLTAYYQMDIVPYIREVKTSLSEVYSGNPTVYSRTALGHYPVYVTFAGGTAYDDRLREMISLTGFNLAGCTLNFENDDPNTLKKSQNTNALVDNTASAELKYDDGKYQIQIPAGAGSGHVYLSKTVGEGDDAVTVKSLNNVNNDNAKGVSTKVPSNKTTGDTDAYADYYNRQPNGVNNNRLTDDVYIDVWEFNREAAIPTNNSALDIMMKVNPANAMIDLAFCDGDLYWSMANNDFSYTRWARALDFIQCTGFAVDKNGRTYGTALGGESGDKYGDNYQFYYSDWGRAGDTRKKSNSIRIGSSAYALTDQDVTNQSHANMAKDRYKSPSIAADGEGHAYLAFFDLLSGDLRFQGGNAIADKGGFGTLTDAYANAPKNDQDGQNGDYHTMFKLDQERSYLQVVATSDGKDTSGNAYQKSGEYVSIGVTSGNTVAMVWYNGKDLLYSYNSTPSTIRTGVNRTGWTTPVTLLSNAGKYCQLVVDSDDNIHVAAWDSAKGDLKYVYIPKANLADLSASNVISCTVDSYGTVGRELTIDVAKDANGKQIPYIGYFANTPKKPRYAYLANPPATYSSASLAGASSGDLYTGVWECTIAPTLKVNGTGANATPSADKNVVTLDEKTRRINVGVWKNSGVLAYSTTGTTGENGTKGTYSGTIRYTSSTNTTASDNNGGKCYGNGSKNGVLAYGVRYTSQQDYVETAQKR